MATQTKLWQLENSTVAGSLLVTDSTNENIHYAPGTLGQFLRVGASGLPEWNTFSLPSEYEQVATPAALPVTGNTDVIYLVADRGDGQPEFQVWTGTAYLAVPTNPILNFGIVGQAGSPQTINHGENINFSGLNGFAMSVGATNQVYVNPPVGTSDGEIMRWDNTSLSWVTGSPLAENGLSVVLNKVELGGLLTKTTTIDGVLSYDLFFNDTKSFNVLNVQKDIVMSAATGGFIFTNPSVSVSFFGTGIVLDTTPSSTAIELKGGLISLQSTVEGLNLNIPSTSSAVAGDVLVYDTTGAIGTQGNVRFKTLVQVPAGTVTGQQLIWDGTAWVNYQDRSETFTGITVATVTLANTPKVGTFPDVYLNGIFQTEGGVDYTISGAVITFSSALVASDRVSVRYKS